MFKVEKLNDTNFHTWKQTVEYALGLKELADHILPRSDQEQQSSAISAKWSKDDLKAKAVIGMTLGKEHLELVSECTSAFAMWKTILELFQRKTLLNKLMTRRRFYTAKMVDSENTMSFISRVRQMASDCKALDISIDDKDIAMTVLCGLPEKYEHLIVAIDTATDDDTFTLDFVKSRLLQEDQRMRDRSGTRPVPDSALVADQRNERRGRSSFACTHCGRPGHNESRCWDKYPHLRPSRPKPRQAGLTAQATRDVYSPDSDSEVAICLMAGAQRPEVDLATKASWIVDSGATTHIANDKRLFTSVAMSTPFSINLGDKSSVQGLGRGTVEMKTVVKGKRVHCRLENVVYAPTMAFNMVSVRVMCRSGKLTCFDEHRCWTLKDNKVILEGKLVDDLYCVVTDTEYSTHTTVAAGLVADVNLWHQRCAHVHVDGIRGMVNHGVVEGINKDLKGAVHRCSACVYGKSTRAPIPKERASRVKHVLDLVHTDVCGPFPEPSLGGSLYFVSFVDDHSRYAWVYPIAAKSDVFERLKSWLAMVENQIGRKLKSLIPGKTLKVLQSDNGGEFLSKAMIRFLQERGIQHRLTTPRNPHQNGVAERMNRTLVELVRTMLHHKDLPKSFWAEALNTAAYVRNRVTTRGLSAKTTPYEVLFHRKPNLSHLRVFGCRCWYTVPRGDVDKLDKRARASIMIGYARGSRGYKLWDVEDGKVVVSRDVKFDELGEHDHAAETHDSDSNVKSADEGADEAGSVKDEPEVDEDSHTSGESEYVSPNDDDSDGTADVPEAEVDDPETDTDSNLRRSARVRKAPGMWWANVTALIANKPTEDPRSFRQAVSGPDGKAWMKSMQLEYDSLVENQCFKVVPRPNNANVVSSKWIYKTKEEQTTDGTLGKRLKARPVACGYSQVEGIDYSETYAPVVKLTSIRVLLATVRKLKLKLHQMDFITAFLNGDLEELIYMEQLEGFEQGDPQKFVCLLLKSMYGLKQSPRQWYARVDDFFVDTLGMERNPSDECVYMRRQGGNILIIALYVDDLLIACNEMSVIVETKLELSSRFKMKDLGESKIILGMDIWRDAEGNVLTLSQSRYAQKIIDRFGMSTARGIATPMDPAVDLYVDSPRTSEPYQSAIGSLMYLMVGTRPDLAFCVGRLAKFVSCPTELHWECVKRVLRYLIHTKELGLVYGGTKADLTPEVFVDADWAGDEEGRVSMSGYVAMMDGAAVAWNARPQEVVALSSAEAEYISMCNGCRETMWLRRLVDGLQVVPRMNGPTSMFVDNQGAISMAHTHAVNRRNKHIDVRYHFNRQAVEDGVVELKYCPTEDMIADMFTKALGRIKLEKFRLGAGLDVTKSADPQ